MALAGVFFCFAFPAGVWGMSVCNGRETHSKTSSFVYRHRLRLRAEGGRM